MAAALPMPEEEWDVIDGSGRWLARVDFAYPEKKVYIEVDGSHHETRRQYVDDLARQNELARAGWLPLRFTKEDVDAKSYVRVIAEVCSGETSANALGARFPRCGKKVRTR